jgi:hypothetical protein
LAFPAFNEEGDLPQGVYRATLPEILDRFGQGSVQRCAVAERLNRLYQLVASTSQLARFVVFGSFVTAKADPNDVDIVLLMENTFDLASVVGRRPWCFSIWKRKLVLERAFSGCAARGRLAGSRR